MTGAGVVVVRLEPTGPLFLCLSDGTGGWDIPKGHLEVGEAPFVCAVRETAEEANVDELTFTWGKRPLVLGRQLAVYVAQTSQLGTVRANPESGILEHTGIEWFSHDQALSRVYDFLRPAITWAHTKVSGT